MDVAMLSRLRTNEGDTALAAAARILAVGHPDPLAAATALRAEGVPADLAAAALTLASLRRKAVAKFGPQAQRLYFTRTSLEQATRSVVADRRAARLVAAGVERVADLGCGVGADSLAFARAGMRVLAVDADPTTAAIAWANLAAAGLDDRAEVRCADATALDLTDVDAVFCDPARRDAARGRRSFDPNAFSPPWSFLASLAARVPATVLKLAPGMDHALIPAGAEAEWVSADGDVVEAAFWHGPLAEVPRRATVLRGDRVDVLTGPGVANAPAGGIGRFVYDPDGAVVRGHLVAEFAATVAGRLADKRIAYVYADAAVATPFASCFEVVARLPYQRTHLRAALRGHRIGRLEILKRGLAVEPDRLRRELRLAGDEAATLMLTRVGETPTALLCRRVPAPTR